MLDAFVGALTRSLRWRAKRQLGLASVTDAYVGAVTFIQRSDSALRLNVHFHTLALDGVYVRDEQGELTFHPLGEPTPEEVAEVARWTYERLLVVLERHGRSLDGADVLEDSLSNEQPVLASCYGASAADTQLLGGAPGQKTSKLVRPVRVVTSPEAPLAEVGGVNVHAQVSVDGRDRRRLERILRYMARPPLAQDRLELRDDGRVIYRFKRPWRDGTHAIVLDPLDFIARLCALVPPPRFHMLRYHGVLAAHASARADVVPIASPSLPAQLPLFTKDDARLPRPAPDRVGDARVPRAGEGAPAAHLARTARRAHDGSLHPDQRPRAARRAVGYDDVNQRFEVSCALPEGEHIQPHEVLDLMLILTYKKIADGRPVQEVRVTFAEEAVARAESRPLLDIGVQVVFLRDDGELVRVE